ncbi:DUF397 domain-containing protein [Spirillospora sp. NPDC052269]
MPRWRTSSYSEGSVNGACVELGSLKPGMVGVRDSKVPAAGHLVLSTVELALLLNCVRHGTLHAASS